MSSDRYLDTPRIRSSEIWGRLVTGLVLFSRQYVINATRLYKNVSYSADRGSGSSG